MFQTPSSFSSYTLTGTIVSNEHKFANLAEVRRAKCQVRHPLLPDGLNAIPGPFEIRRKSKLKTETD